jgi:hypothetical protein
MTSFEKTHSSPKSYKQALLTPTTTPTNTPASTPPKDIFMIKTPVQKIKWILNYNVENRICSVCQKGLEWDECNSYYTIYEETHLALTCKYVTKIYTDKYTSEKILFCDKCKKNKIENSLDCFKL